MGVEPSSDSAVSCWFDVSSLLSSPAPLLFNDSLPAAFPFGEVSEHGQHKRTVQAAISGKIDHPLLAVWSWGRVCQVVEKSERVIIRPLTAISRSRCLFRARHLLPPVDLSHLHVAAAQQAEEQHQDRVLARTARDL